jgi:hypothetical protein
MDNFTADALLHSEAFAQQLAQAEIRCGKCRTSMTVKSVAAVGPNVIVLFACSNSSCQQIMLTLNPDDMAAFAKEGKLVLPLRITLTYSEAEGKQEHDGIERLMQMRAFQQMKLSAQTAVAYPAWDDHADKNVAPSNSPNPYDLQAVKNMLTGLGGK